MSLIKLRIESQRPEQNSEDLKYLFSIDQRKMVGFLCCVQIHLIMVATFCCVVFPSSVHLLHYR